MSTQTDRLGGARGSLAYKAPCRVSTTAAITLSGTQTIDSVAVVDGDRVLVRHQTDSTQNGIWIVRSAGWERARDFNGNSDIVSGTKVYVANSTGAGEYVVTSANPITVGTSNITFISADLSLGSDVDSMTTIALFDDEADYLFGRDTSGSVSGKGLGKNLGFTQSGTGAALRSLQSKIRESISVADFGTTGDGVADDTAEIQAAIDSMSTTGGSVFLPKGTYLISAALKMRPLVRLWAAPGTVTIKQAASANISKIIEFTTYAAHGASLYGLILDGNKANNTVDLTVEIFAVYILDANDVTVSRCQIKEWAGHGVYVTSGLRPLIADCYLQNLYAYGVYVNHPTLGAYNAPIVRDCRFEYVSWHAIVYIKSTYGRIERNRVLATRVSSQVVTVSGNTVTWVSGSNFADVKPGNFIIYNGGVEALITAVGSSTSVTLLTSPGDGVSLPSAMGGADVISVLGCSTTLVSENIITGGASLGISIAGITGTGTDVGAIVTDNVIESIGSAGLSIQTSGGFLVRDAVFSNNKVVDSGLNTTASSSTFNTAMTVSGTASNILVVNNSWLSYGTAAMYGLNVVSTGPAVRALGNRANTTTDSGVITGGASVALSTGWGTGATATEIKAYEDCVTFLVTTSTAATAASPSITVTHKVVPPRIKAATFNNVLTSASPLTMQTFYPDAELTSVGVVSGTPGTSSTYRFVLRL